MPKNKNNKTSLLEDAIADAQVVLDTAIANAEATLTEKFRPRLKSLLAQHIQEEMDGEDYVDADDLDDYRDENGDELDDDDRYDDYEIDDIDSVQEGELEMEIPADDEDEEDDEEEMEMDEMDHDEMDYEEEEEEMLSQEIAKLESMIADLREEDEDEMDDEDMDDMDYEDEDEDEEEMDEVYEFDLNEFIDGQMTRPAEIDDEDGHETELSLGDEGEGVDAGSTYDIEGEPVTYDLHGDLTEDFDIDSLLDEIAGDTSDLAENAQLQAENSKLRKEVKKHRKVVNKMRGKLHEVGLLNAKLLYTNKIFRRFNLKEDQKVKVLKQFDNAENMKEAKIIYKTLSESLDQGATRKDISESVNRRLTSSQSSTKPSKNIISDSDNLKSRFKKLANIQ